MSARLLRLDLYLARYVLSASALAILVLAALSMFFSFTGVVGDIGQGRFGLPEALLYALYATPLAGFQLLPMAALLGSLLGLGLLADGSELVAIRAAGMSIRRIALSVLGSGLLLSLSVVFVGEWLAPKSELAASQLLSLSRIDQVSRAGRQGVWLREGNDFVNVGEVADSGQLRDLRIFRLDDSGRLDVWLEAAFARFDGQAWRLFEVRQWRFSDQGISPSRSDFVDWPGRFDPRLFDAVAINPRALSTLALWRLIRFQQANGLDSGRFELALWSKWTQPVATAVMVLLGLGFVFGRSRGSNAGKRIVLGILLGVGFYAVNTTVARLGLLYGVPVGLSAVLPSALFFAVGLWRLRALH